MELKPVVGKMALSMYSLMLMLVLHEDIEDSIIWASWQLLWKLV